MEEGRGEAETQHLGQRRRNKKMRKRYVLTSSLSLSSCTGTRRDNEIAESDETVGTK